MNKVKSLCKFCSGPSYTCQCRNRPKINNYISGYSVTRKGFQLNTLGIEIEAARWNNLAQPDGVRGGFGGVPGTWYHDGSVSSGSEWASAPITVRPTKNGASSKGLIEDLISIADAYTTNKITSDTTCGFHVHIDARELSYWQVVKIWHNYIAIQNMVYRFGHPGREATNILRNRTYCNRYTTKLFWKLEKLLKIKPSETKAWITDQFFLGSTEVFRDSALRSRRMYDVDNPRYNGGTPNPAGTSGVGVDRETLTYLKNYKYHNNRYYGLNFMSWFKQGTIEWRTQGHPIDGVDIVMWPLVCCLITARLLNKPLITKPIPNDLEMFLRWLEAPPEMQTYLRNKYKTFEKDWQTTLVTPTYKELI